MKLLRYIAPLILLLSACAPSTRGSSIREALVTVTGQQVEVERGNDLFLRIDYGLADFGLERSDLSGAFWIPAGVNEESASVTSRFALRDERVPGGWSLELAEVRANRTTETRYGRETGEVTYRLSAVLRLRVPAGAELGVTTVRAETVARGGANRSLELPVRVRAASVD